MKFNELTEADIEGLARRLFPKIIFSDDFDKTDEGMGEFYIYNPDNYCYFGINILGEGYVELNKNGILETNGLVFFSLPILMDWIKEKELEFES